MLINKNKLFNKYINILSCQHLRDIITYFKNLINILNICETIDGHNFLSKKVILVGEFFNKKKFYNIVL